MMYWAWASNTPREGWANYAAYGSIALFVYQIGWMMYKKVEYYNFRLWFVILQYLFIFGRIILHAFGWDKGIFWNLMEYYSVSAMFKASIYGLAYTQAIFTGLFWNYSKSNALHRTVSSRTISGQCMVFIGVAMLILSVPFRLSNDMTAIRTQTEAGGYVAVAIDNGMNYAFGMLLPVAVMYLICSDTLKRRHVNLIMLVLMAYMGVTMVLSGDRRYSITALIAVILCYMQRFKIKIDWKRILLIAVGVQLVLLVLATIRTTRMHVTSFAQFWDLFVEAAQTSNIFYETFSEFGLTFFIYAAGVQFFPGTFAFKWGTTYLLAPITIIPMSGLIFPGLQSSISAHMDCKSITGHPLGAALGEEIFCNFGYLAPIFAVIIGVVISKIMQQRKNDPQAMARYYGLFYIMLNLVRASTTEILRLAAYAVIIPWILIKVYRFMRR